MDVSTPSREHHPGDFISALRHVPSHLRLWIPAVLILWLDLWSKSAAFKKLPADASVPIIRGFLEFRRSLNDGAVFGAFTGRTGVFITASILALAFVLYLFGCSRPYQRVMHVSLALILAGATGNLYDRAFVKADVAVVSYGDGERRSHIGVLMNDPNSERIQIGDWPDGTNVRSFDRKDVELRRQGVVRDFIKFVPRFPKWVPKLGGMDIWPWVFNVADAALVIGVVLLLIQGWFDRPRHRNAEDSVEMAGEATSATLHR